MNIFFINNPETVDALLQAQKADREQVGGDCLFLCWRWVVKRRLEKEGLPWLVVDDLLSWDECRKIDEQSLSFSQSWYLVEGMDFTRYKDISLGHLCEFNVRFQITIILQWIAYIVNVFEQYQPKRAFYDLPHDSEIAILLREVMGSFDCELIPVVSNNRRLHPGSFNRFTYSTFELQKRSVGYTRILKELALCVLTLGRHKFSIGTAEKYLVKDSLVIRYILCTLGFLYNRLARADKGEAGHRALFYSNAHVNYVLRSWLERGNGSVTPVVALDSPPPPDLLLRLLRSKPKASLLPPGPLLPSRNPTRGIWDCWREVKNDNEYRKRFSFRGIQFFTLVESYLDEVVARRFPLLASKVRYLENQFQRLSIKGLIVPYGSLDMYRLAVKVAQKLTIPTIVIQHGTFVKGWDQDRKVIDYSIVWGPTYERTAIEEGMPEERIFVTGAPAMDRYFAWIQQIKQNSCKSRRLSKICVLTTNSTIGTGFGRYFMAEEYLKAFLPVVATACKGKEIVVKIHPSESVAYYEWLLEELGVSSIRIVRDADLAGLLAESDLVIVFSTSTVALESLAFGKETMCVFLDPRGRLRRSPLPPPYNGVGIAKVVFGPEGLKKAILSVLRQNRRISPYNEHIAKEAEQYLGPIDGRAGERVMSVIRQLLE